jgi:hypothetical protein
VITTESLFDKWKDWLKQIDEDQLRDLLINRHIFCQFRESANAHGGDNDATELAEWMHQCYVAFACAAVRKISQQPKRGFHSVSLGILLNDLKNHQAHLTRANFAQMYGRDSPASRFSDRDFDGIVGRAGCNAVPLAMIDKDIKDMKGITRSVKQLTDQVIVHTDVNRSKVVIPTYGELDGAIDFLQNTFATYHLLITARAYTPVPLEEYDVKQALARLWHD